MPQHLRHFEKNKMSSARCSCRSQVFLLLPQLSTRKWGKWKMHVSVKITDCQWMYAWRNELILNEAQAEWELFSGVSPPPFTCPKHHTMQLLSLLIRHTTGYQELLLSFPWRIQMVAAAFSWVNLHNGAKPHKTPQRNTNANRLRNNLEQIKETNYNTGPLEP